MKNISPISIDAMNVTFAEALKQLEAEYFCRMLTAARLNQAEAARRAGMSYSAFRDRVSRLDIVVNAA